MAAALPPDPKENPQEKAHETAGGKRDRWTVLDVLRWVTGRFGERGLPTPRLDAEVLIAAALGLPRVQLYVQFERPLEATELGAIRDYVRRRQGGESVAYIIGRKEFFGLDFAVDARVLVPRPDTETLVDEALARLATRAPPGRDQTRSDERDQTRSADGKEDRDEDGSGTAVAPAVTVAAPRVADIGTGSGAIVVALGKRRPDAALFAVDRSTPALEVAAANAAHHGVAVTFLEGDLAAPLELHAPFDLLVANLPYVRTADLAGLAPEVRVEPAMALDGGPEGLSLIARLVATAPALLAVGGALALEVGAGQAAVVADMLRTAGFTELRVRRDLGAVERVVSGIRP